MLPEDLLGLPFRDGDATKYCPHGWLLELCQPGAYGVLVLDDLPAAAQAVQVAARQLSLERRVHDHVLAEGVFVVVTGNRREDRSAASTLPAHFRNSILILGVGVELDEWAKWYGRQPDLDPAVPAFLRFRQERLSMLPQDADKRGAFATPRSWAMLGRIMGTAEALDALFEVAAGLVGEGVATELAAFVRIRGQLPDPVAVFDEPKRALRDPRSLGSPDKLIAMATRLAEIGAHRCLRGKGREKSEAPLKLLRALAWVTRENREYCGAGISTYVASGGDMAGVLRAARAHKDDPVITGLVAHIKSAIRGAA